MESARKSVGALCGAHAAMLLKEVFTMWKEDAIADRTNLELDKLRAELVQLKMAQKQGLD